MKITIDVPDKLIADAIEKNLGKLHRAVSGGVEDAFDFQADSIRKKTCELVRDAMWKAFNESIKKAIQP